MANKNKEDEQADERSERYIGFYAEKEDKAWAKKLVSLGPEYSSISQVMQIALHEFRLTHELK